MMVDIISGKYREMGEIMKKILSIILLAGLSVNLLAHTEDAAAQGVDRFVAFKSC